MGFDVDKSGCDHHSQRIDFFGTGGRPTLSYSNNMAATNGDVGLKTGCTCPIEKMAAPNDQIARHVDSLIIASPQSATIVDYRFSMLILCDPITILFGAAQRNLSVFAP